MCNEGSGRERLRASRVQWRLSQRARASQLTLCSASTAAHSKRSTDANWGKRVRRSEERDTHTVTHGCCFASLAFCADTSIEAILFGNHAASYF
jgi:hypothetical protein